MLVRNELLSELMRGLVIAPDNWKEVVSDAKGSAMYQRGRYDESNLRSHFAGIILRRSLKKVAAPCKGRVFINPIRDGETAGRYVLKYNDGKLVIWNGVTNKVYSAADAVVLADGLPALFKIKLGRYRDRGMGTLAASDSEHREWRLPLVHPARRGVDYEFKRERIDQFLEPFRTFFGSNCGYVLVMSPDEIDPRAQERFEYMGGIIKPFYTDRKTYREDVRRIRRIYGL